MERNTILKRDSLGNGLDYIYPDFKKCQLVLFSLALLEYVTILSIILILIYINNNLISIKYKKKKILSS